MFGHFHSDNGMARFDSFNSAFWRIYENLCAWNEEHDCVYESFIIMSVTTNRLKQMQNKKDNGDSHFIKSCQQRKTVEYKTMNHLLMKYFTYKNEHELANIVK